MYSFWLLFVLIMMAQAMIESKEHGINGWHIPQSDGTFVWMNKSNALEKLAYFEENSPYRDRCAVTFYLHTRRNQDKGQLIVPHRVSIEATNFDVSKPVRILIHGWLGNHDDEFNKDLRAAILHNNDYNIISVDYEVARSLIYIESVAYSNAVSKKVAQMIDYLAEEFHVSLSNLHMIGFSLGCHVAGFAGRKVRMSKVGKIVACDPAGPLFDYDGPDMRLNKNDAIYVESIQTNSDFLGIWEPVGTASFFPNGGEYQPLCNLDIMLGVCSHNRSKLYYTESLLNDNFLAYKCKTRLDAAIGFCNGNNFKIRLGAESNELIANGIYYVPVNAHSPFGSGAIKKPRTNAI